LRQHVDLNMRSFAVSDCQNTFIAKTPARTNRFAFLCASPRWIPGAHGLAWSPMRFPCLDSRRVRMWQT
jgi:hypothetical protein